MNLLTKSPFPRCAVMIAVVLFPTAHAETWSLADANLKRCVEEIAQKQGWRRVEDVTEIRCHSKDISSLAGLEAFAGLRSLSLHNNRIAAIDASAWPQLQELNVAKNNLNHLHLSNLPHLRQVYLFGNQVTELVLENLSQLEQFKANSNGMTAFRYQNLPSLEKIYLFDNQLETMDIHNLPAIKYMDVRQNPMPDELYEEMDRMNGVTVLHDGNEEDWQ